MVAAQDYHHFRQKQLFSIRPASDRHKSTGTRDKSQGLNNRNGLSLKPVFQFFYEIIQLGL
ncbi:MAG: hypothetical protein CO090_01845 [Acidobacteria bacterium CG_4_9_14_3_um_filter_49_7]|nr:MAG: hypothetical protein CO090_01845 [Acidobacteria bacterium CG_4_9_14_3_um_filter_49_7]